MIKNRCQSISKEDIDAVVEVLNSDFLTQGTCVPIFEKALAEYCGAKHAVAVTNGTDALRIACFSLGVGKGDIVWTSPISFVASANCALYCQADVDFVDINPSTGCMSVNALKQKLVKAKKENKLPKLIIPVHLAGLPCKMGPMSALCSEYGISILEDACHALSSEYKGYKIGGCHFSNAAAFSFHPVKPITTGEGGAVLTNDTQLYKKLCLFRSHGIVRENIPAETPWLYRQEILGYNCRMTDIQAALGKSQLKRLDSFREKRLSIDNAYRSGLTHLPLDVLAPVEDAISSCHLFIIKIHDKSQRSIIFKKLKAQGIRVNVHYIPIHLQPFYKRLGFKKGDFPEAEEFYERIITLPIHTELAHEQISHIITTLNVIFKEH